MPIDRVITGPDSDRTEVSADHPRLPEVRKIGNMRYKNVSSCRKFRKHKDHRSNIMNFEIL